MLIHCHEIYEFSGVEIRETSIENEPPMNRLRITSFLASCSRRNFFSLVHNINGRSRYDDRVFTFSSLTGHNEMLVLHGRPCNRLIGFSSASNFSQSTALPGKRVLPPNAPEYFGKQAFAASVPAGIGQLDV